MKKTKHTDGIVHKQRTKTLTIAEYVHRQLAILAARKGTTIANEAQAAIVVYVRAELALLEKAHP